MPTLDELAAKLTKNAQALAENLNDKLSGFVSVSKFSNPEIDTRRKMVFFEIEETININDTGKVKGKVCVFPGKDGVAELRFYNTADDFDRSKSDLDFVLDSLSFEPSYGYADGLVADSPRADFNLDRVLMFGLIGGILGPLSYSLLRWRNPSSSPGLLRLRVFFALLIMLGGIDILIYPPSGPVSLTVILGCMIVGVSGLVFLWSKGMKVSSPAVGESPTQDPPPS